MICEGILLTLTALQPLMWDENGSSTRLYYYPDDLKPGQTLCIHVKSGKFIFSTDGRVIECSPSGEFTYRREHDKEVARLSYFRNTALKRWAVPKECRSLQE